MQKLKIRHDDFDWRLPAEAYIENHEKFIQAGLDETAVVQYTADGRVPNYPEKLITYMKEAPNWDIQLHGWAHDDYSRLPKWRIEEDLRNARAMAFSLFGKQPTVWYPPWNATCLGMIEMAEDCGMIVDNESYDISKFIREMKSGEYQGHSVYFHLWNRNEKEKIDEMLHWAKVYEDNRLK